jgi:hypothetical protein
MPINFSSVPYLNNQHDKPVILNSADDAIVANPVAPSAAQWPGERVAKLAGVRLNGEAFGEKPGYALCFCAPEFG